MKHKTNVLTGLIAIAIFSIALYAALVPSSVLRVPGDYPTIQDAIYASTSGDTILVAQGTYYENLVIGYIDPFSLTVMSETGPEATIIDGRDRGSVISIWGYTLSGPSVNIVGFTIQNGYTSGSGGGISCDEWSSLRARNNIIRSNRAGYRGGGISINSYDFGYGMIENNTIVENDGGGIDAGWDVTIRNNIVADNYSDEGIFSNSSPTITYNDVWGNSAGNYGGSLPDLTGIDGNISENPLFSSNYTLDSTSPCIDAGDPSLEDACQPPGLGAVTSDMGAYGGPYNCSYGDSQGPPSWYPKFPYKDSQLWYISAGYDRYPQPRQYEVVFKIYVDPYHGQGQEVTDGRPVLTSATGTVSDKDWYPDMGNTVIIDHGHGYESWYSNLKTFRKDLKIGQRLLQGTYIGTTSGNSGDEDGLWFSMRQNGESIPLVGFSGFNEIIVGQWYRSHQVMPEFDPINDLTTFEFPYDVKFPYREEEVQGSGNSWHITYGSIYHRGPLINALDLNWGSGDSDCGHDVLSPVFGRIIEAGWRTGYGNQVLIDCGNGYSARVAHMNPDFKVQVDDIIKQGTHLGFVDKTGWAGDSCHMHFEIWHGGSTVLDEGVSGNYDLPGDTSMHSYNTYIPPPDH